MSVESTVGDFCLLIATGPYARLHPGDTLTYTAAFVWGMETADLRANSEQLRGFHRRNVDVQSILPSPALTVTREGTKAILNWSPIAGTSSVDPVHVWDCNDPFLSALPDTHWRRRNPQPGTMGGGQLFEDFRVYRSESAGFDTTRFVLLR